MTVTHPTHVYTGPLTRWGLEPGTRVRKVGHKGGTLVHRESDGREFLVVESMLKPIGPPKFRFWRFRRRWATGTLRRWPTASRTSIPSRRSRSSRSSRR